MALDVEIVFAVDTSGLTEAQQQLQAISEREIKVKVETDADSLSSVRAKFDQVVRSVDPASAAVDDFAKKLTAIRALGAVTDPNDTLQLNALAAAEKLVTDQLNLRMAAVQKVNAAMREATPGTAEHTAAQASIAATEAAENLAKATKEAAVQAAAEADQIDKLTQRYLPLEAARKQAVADLTAIQAAQAKGLGSPELATAAQSKITEIDAKTPGTAENAAAMAKDAADKEAAALQKEGDAVDKLVGKYQPLQRERQKAVQDLAAIQAARKKGFGDDGLEEAVKTRISSLDKSIGSFGSSLNLSRNQMMQLSAAGVNAGQALASGMSVGRVALTEGAQVLGAFIQGEGGMARLVSFVGPLALVAGAFALIALRINDVVHAQKQLSLDASLGGQGLTTGQIGRAANAAALSTSLSHADASAVGGTFARAGVGQDTAQLTELIKLTADYAAVTGTDATTAAKTLAGQFKDIQAATKSLAENFHGLTAAQKENIDSMANSGQLKAAQAALLAAQKQLFDGSEALGKTALDNLLAYFKKNYDNAMEGTARAVGSVFGAGLGLDATIDGKNDQERLTNAKAKVADLNKEMARLKSLQDVQPFAFAKAETQRQMDGVTNSINQVTGAIENLQKRVAAQADPVGTAITRAYVETGNRLSAASDNDFATRKRHAQELQTAAVENAKRLDEINKGKGSLPAGSFADEERRKTNEAVAATRAQNDALRSTNDLSASQLAIANKLSGVRAKDRATLQAQLEAEEANKNNSDGSVTAAQKEQLVRDAVARATAGQAQSAKDLLDTTRDQTTYQNASVKAAQAGAGALALQEITNKALAEAARNNLVSAAALTEEYKRQAVAALQIQAALDVAQSQRAAGYATQNVGAASDPAARARLAVEQAINERYVDRLATARALGDVDAANDLLDKQRLETANALTAAQKNNLASLIDQQAQSQRGYAADLARAKILGSSYADTQAQLTSITVKEQLANSTFAEGTDEYKKYEAELLKTADIYKQLDEYRRSYTGGTIDGLREVQASYTDAGAHIKTALLDAFSSTSDAITELLTKGATDWSKIFTTIATDMTKTGVDNLLGQGAGLAGDALKGLGLGSIGDAVGGLAPGAKPDGSALKPYYVISAGSKTGSLSSDELDSARRAFGGKPDVPGANPFDDPGMAQFGEAGGGTSGSSSESDATSGFFGSLSSGFKGVWDKISSTFGSVASGLGSAFTSVTGGIGDAFKFVTDNIGSGFSSLFSGLGDGLKGIFSGISSLFGGGEGGGSSWISSLAGAVSSYYGGGTVAAASGEVLAGGYKTFATGGGLPVGQYDSPTYFPMAGGQTGLVGEAGPEAVLPLSRGKDGKLGLAGGDDNRSHSTTVNNNVTINSSSGDPNEIQQATFDALKRANDMQIRAVMSREMRPGGMLNATRVR